MTFQAVPLGTVSAGKPDGLRMGSTGIIYEKCRLPAGVAVIGGVCKGYGEGGKGSARRNTRALRRGAGMVALAGAFSFGNLRNKPLRKML
jgi:hypothetical protein